MYYVIHNSEGDTTVDELTKEELLERAEENYYGSVGYLKKLPDRNTHYWNGDVLIIKGEIAELKAKEVVKKYDID